MVLPITRRLYGRRIPGAVKTTGGLWREESDRVFVPPASARLA
jgi:hypothetical protein